MIEMNNLPGEISMTRCTLIKIGKRHFLLVSGSSPLALQRLLVALPFFDGFTIGFVARGMNAVSFAILDHLSVGMHYGLLPVGFVIILYKPHHRILRLLWQFKFGISS